MSVLTSTAVVLRPGVLRLDLIEQVAQHMAALPLGAEPPDQAS
jgi:hypothetical protein